MSKRTYEKRLPCSVILSVALISMHYGVAAAQESQPNKSQSPTARPTTSQRGPTQNQALVQLSHQIESLKSDLERMHERFGENDLRVTQAKKELETLFDLKKRLVQLSQGELNESKKAEMSSLFAEITASAYKPTSPRPAPSDDQLAMLQQELQHSREQLAEREKQMAMMAQQLAAQQSHRDLPALEGAQVKAYTLRYVPAREAAQTIESLIGAATIRLAVDERNNSLIVYGKADSLGALDTLLAQIDRQAPQQAAGEKPKQDAAAAPRSLLLRVFWLADGLPEGIGQKPSDFLPKSVLLATNKLGLETPRLVTQSVNSLALGRDEAVDFSTSVPAVLLDQPAVLNLEGRLKAVSDDRVRLEMGVRVGGPAINCELRGSLATPLGHYMVLGTANSMIAEGGNMPGGMPGAPGMSIRRGPMGPAGRFGRPGPGFDPEASGAGGEFGTPAAEPNAGPGGGQGVASPVKPKFETSRFAFVVQVIGGQSYEAEKSKSDNE